MSENLETINDIPFANWPDACEVIKRQILPNLSFYVHMDEDSNTLTGAFITNEELALVPEYAKQEFVSRMYKFVLFATEALEIEAIADKYIYTPADIYSKMGFQTEVLVNMAEYNRLHEETLSMLFMKYMGFPLACATV